MASHTELLETFERYARVAGAQVAISASETDAAASIFAISSGPILCTAPVRHYFPDLCAALESAGRSIAVAEEMADKEESASALAAALAGTAGAGIGIIVAQAGIAETGSLVLADDGLAPRLLSMLADICVALLPASSIVPGLDEAGALLSELNNTGHRYISLVTGPSRTADIERVLTIGVQGPKALHIIILAEEHQV